jgi:S1-C subfamily serine protease
MPNSRAAIHLCSLLLVLPGLSSRAQDPSPTPTPALSPQAAHDLLHLLDDAFVSVFEKVAPAVVIIEADKKASNDDQDQNFDFYFHSPESGDGAAPQHVPDAPSVRSEGSGFIARPDGYIYTNYHVIEDSDKIEVKLRDHRHFTARLIGADERTDIAILKIDATDLPAVTLLDSDSVRVGQMCFAIGIPYNLDYSFCRGVVSATGRGNLTSTATKPMYEDYIQTDAFINPGNSGGPLFDIDGRVMGMNTLINGIGRGLAFAIPSDMLRDVGAELIASGHATHPWLGITVSTSDDGPSGSVADQGVRVETIEADAPAYKSDLRPQDTITKVDGVPVLTAHDLQHEILRKKVGQSVDLSVSRAGRTLDIAVVTDELPADLTQVAQSHHLRAKIHPSDSTSYGLIFGGAAHPDGQSQPVQDKVGSGVTVTSVVADSPAGRAGLKPGDLITAVDQKPVSDSGVCLELLAAHRGPAGPILDISRDGHKSSATLDTDGTAKQ